MLSQYISEGNECSVNHMCRYINNLMFFCNIMKWEIYLSGLRQGRLAKMPRSLGKEPRLRAEVLQIL
jgi:hypothetical protein